MTSFCNTVANASRILLMTACKYEDPTGRPWIWSALQAIHTSRKIRPRHASDLSHTEQLYLGIPT